MDVISAHQTRWDLLAKGLYFQAYMSMAVTSKRHMRRRKHYLVVNGKVVN